MKSIQACIVCHCCSLHMKAIFFASSRSKIRTLDFFKNKTRSKQNQFDAQLVQIEFFFLIKALKRRIQSPGLLHFRSTALSSIFFLYRPKGCCSFRAWLWTHSFCSNAKVNKVNWPDHFEIALNRPSTRFDLLPFPPPPPCFLLSKLPSNATRINPTTFQGKRNRIRCVVVSSFFFEAALF